MRCSLLFVLLAAYAASAVRVRITAAPPSSAVLYDLISLDSTCNAVPVAPGLSWGFAYFKVRSGFVFALNGSPNPDCVAASPNSTLTTTGMGVPLTGRVATTNIDLGTNIMVVTARGSVLGGLGAVVLAAFLL